MGLTAVMLLGASTIAADLENLTIKSCYDGDICLTGTGVQLGKNCCHRRWDAHRDNSRDISRRPLNNKKADP